MQKHPRLSLLERLEQLPDPRVRGRCDHELVDVLMIALCCLLCGGESFNDMADFGRAKRPWFKTFLRLRGGIPRHDTFNRVLSALKPEAFLEVFMAWTQSVRTTVAEEIVALDGKALRRALDCGDRPRVIVSAWAASNALVLGQIQVPDKTNEITAVPPLLRALELSGCIVTLDAMGCQKEIAREIQEADAEYVLALKGNQGQCYAEIKRYLDDAVARHDEPAPASKNAVPLAYQETVEKDHGRLETRRYWQSGDVDWFADKGQWAGLRSVGVVESVRQVGQAAPTVERRYYLSSLGVDAEKFARAVRGHWGIENSLHWVLDVQCGEDRSRARAGHAAANLATLRRLALNLLKQDRTKQRGLKGKQLNAAWDHAYLLRLLAF